MQQLCQHSGCGGMFQAYPSSARRFCSQPCAGKARAESGFKMPTKPRTGHLRPCERCGELVWVRKHSEGRKRFCSRECFDSWQSRNTLLLTCQVCGEPWKVSPSQKYYRALRYCSRACEGRSRMKRPLDREHNGKPAVQDQHGYVRIYQPDHSRATKGGWVFEHRWIVEQSLGRVLLPSEHVHHVNHDRADNRPENLHVLSHSEHSSITGRENGEAVKAAVEARQMLAEYERRYGPISV